MSRKVFSKLVPVKEGIVQLTHDDLFFMHLSGIIDFEPFLHEDGGTESIILFVESNTADYYRDDLIKCGFEESKYV